MSGSPPFDESGTEQEEEQYQEHEAIEKYPSQGQCA